MVLPDEQLLQLHQASLHAYAAELLDEYVARRAQQSLTVRPKEFNDPLWGTLQVRAVEVVVMDSPLLQRLRRIRQLGVAHLVYPAAVHTRLEHSIGVCHQVQRLIESINDHAAPDESGVKPTIGPAYAALLRLTGLCHDIGHGFMSHVVENALDNNRECDDIRLAFQRRGPGSRVRKNQLSEIAAYYLIGSPAFRALLEQANRLAPSDLPAFRESQTTAEKLDEYQALIQAIIVSDQVDPSFPLLQELISGPFDADKLDYMPRDAMMCGVPVVTDVARLIQKSRAVRRASASTPEAVKRLGDARDNYVVTGIARSGARTLDELALGRALLFDKIYRHQKVRAAEVMVSSIVTELLAASPEHPAMLPFLFADEEILGLTFASAAAALGVDQATDEQRAHLDTACELASRMRDRRLLARGFAFSSKMPLDPYRNDAQQRVGVDELNRAARDPRRRSAIVSRVIAEAERISELLEQPRPSQVLAGHPAEPFVWIAPPVVSDDSGDATQIGHAYLIDEVGTEDRRADQDYAETRGWSDAYVATRDLGLVFCPAEIAESIYLASEVVVREDFRVRVPVSMLQFAKMDRRRLDQLRSRLTELGYYDNKPLDLRALPAVLARGDLADRLDRILARLNQYQGPVTFDEATGKVREQQLSRDRIRDWLRQFQDERIIEVALSALERIDVIGRTRANEVLETYLGNESLNDASIVPLGEPRDSSSALAYLVGETAQRHGCQARSLRGALAFGRHVVMLDDFVGRGSAAITIFEGWLGADDTQDLHQERPPELSEHEKELLRNAELYVVFASGYEEGGQALRQRCEELGLNVRVHVADTAVPSIDELVGSEEDLELFKAFCRDRAKEIFAVQGRDDTWMADRLLGYGDHALLLLSAFNTPTATLTCLWNGGEEEGQWHALFPRRAKV